MTAAVYGALSSLRRIRVLTSRDVEWLRELSEGKTFKELTGSSSEQYAKNRVQSIRAFLGTRNTVHAVAEAIRRGIIK